MIWRPTWSNRALKDLRRLDKTTAARVLAAIDRYAETSYGDVTYLTASEPPEWRLRVGDYRVRFELDEVSMTMTITHVRHRRDAYRD